jgi:hypothetical protein
MLCSKQSKAKRVTNDESEQNSSLLREKRVTLENTGLSKIDHFGRIGQTRLKNTSIKLLRFSLDRNGHVLAHSDSLSACQSVAYPPLCAFLFLFRREESKKEKRRKTI